MLTAGCTESTDDGGGAQESSARSGSSSSTSTSSTPDPDGGTDWTHIAAQVEASVVSISVVGAQGAGQGSGVVIDTEGHVLTNSHVVAPAIAGGQARVALADARVFSAELVGSDGATDLAVIQITDSPADLPALEFGDSEAVRVGQPVMALGNPLGLSHTVTLGIVSALDRPVTTENRVTTAAVGTPVVTNAIQTDAAVNPGNSGGALVDGNGRLVGINSSIATLGAANGASGSIGLGFAIPSNQARWVAQELIDSGRVQHAYLGVSLQNAVVAIDGVDREAAGITAVAPGTPAAEAGLRPGESVVEVDGEIVAGAESLVAQIRERPPGSEVDLVVLSRAGQTREVVVEFGTRPGP